MEIIHILIFKDSFYSYSIEFIIQIQTMSEEITRIILRYLIKTEEEKFSQSQGQMHQFVFFTLFQLYQRNFTSFEHY